MKPIILILLTLSFLPAVSRAQNTPPPFKLKDLRGRAIRLESYKGKVVLLNFWATWCAPCRAETPDLIGWQRTYRGQLQIIGITYPPQRASEVRRFVRQLKVNYPIALGTEEVKRRFDASDILPITVVIDRQGKLREVIQGILLAEEFDEKIVPLLR